MSITLHVHRASIFGGSSGSSGI
ncbi:MAG: hypothetical protein RLZZ15_2236, partial [Verrucomicrobiota bacterium]